MERIIIRFGFRSCFQTLFVDAKMVCFRMRTEVVYTWNNNELIVVFCSRSNDLIKFAQIADTDDRMLPSFNF